MLESLEAREVPATNLWLGGTGAWNVPGNWSDGVPTADDVLIFGGPSNLGVNFPTTSGLSFAGLVMQSSYTGTLGFQAAVTFGSYQQSGGYTFQFSPAATVTATGTFVWTGGGINTSTNPATYELKGVTTGQIGTDTTTLQSGSKFVIDKLGSVTSWVKQHGVLNLVNGVGIEVNEGATLDQRRINQQGGNQPEVNTTNEILIKGQTYSKGGKLSSVKIQGGGLGVKAGGLTVTGKVPTTDWGVTLYSGILAIDNGETLKAVEGVWVGGGTLSTVAATDDITDQIATIDGGLRVNGSAAVISVGVGGTTVPTYSTLKVTETAELWEGTFESDVDHTSNDNRDAIDTKDQLDCKAAFKIEVTGHGFANPVITHAWDLLVSKNGFQNQSNTDPTCQSGPTYTTDRSADGKNLVATKH